MVPLRFDVELLRADTADRGWKAADLARSASVSHETVRLVFKGERHNPKTWAKLALALGKTVADYRIKTKRARTH